MTNENKDCLQFVLINSLDHSGYDLCVGFINMPTVVKSYEDLPTNLDLLAEIMHTKRLLEKYQDRLRHLYGIECPELDEEIHFRDFTHLINTPLEYPNARRKM